MILNKISKNGKNIVLEKLENGCIKCVSHCLDKDGYVRISYKEKQNRLHRVLYEIKYGTIPKGLVVRHKCDNRYCCNIEHLEIGTVKDNVRDMIERGRDKYHSQKSSMQGELNKWNKLSKEQIKDIYFSKLGYRKLSRIYNVSKTTIYLIKKKMMWKWYTDSLDN